MEYNIKFGDSLKEIISNKDIKEIAEDLNLTTSTIYSWMRNETEPTRKNLIKLADYFKCSIEFLIGRSVDERIVTPVVCPPFEQNLKKIMSEVGLSTYKLKKKTRYSNEYFRRWRSGSQPFLSTLIELAKILNDCTIDYLIGRE